MRTSDKVVRNTLVAVVAMLGLLYLLRWLVLGEPVPMSDSIAALIALVLVLGDVVLCIACIYALRLEKWRQYVRRSLVLIAALFMLLGLIIPRPGYVSMKVKSGKITGEVAKVWYWPWECAHAVRLPNPPLEDQCYSVKLKDSTEVFLLLPVGYKAGGDAYSLVKLYDKPDDIWQNVGGALEDNVDGVLGWEDLVFPSQGSPVRFRCKAHATRLISHSLPRHLKLAGNISLFQYRN